MPLPRKSSPRRNSRRSRSRSRSHSPKTSHRRSRSRSREKRRSRSPREKKKYAERHNSRSRSRERKRSRSYEDKRRSRSDSPPKHRAKSPNRRGSTPDERSYPVKRLADSSGKHASYRSKSRSPVPAKKSKDYRYKSENPEYSQRKPSKHRSPSPHKGRHADEPSSSSLPRKRSNSRNKDEIDYVKIIDPSPRGKLTKRFTTPEQKVQGPFDFEENITIGIYRGPHHMELDDDVPVNYDFNPKTFVMLHPKKDYHKPVFEREEILAFKHDEILDEEAYVEKRTITVKPSEKKSSKWSNQSDYKITVGSDSYGDRRKVQDSGSKSRTSRRDSYEPDVTVRLDPKPDPRYEKMYREQKRHGEADLMDEKIQRNPNDLRYSLLRKDRDTDRDYERDRDRSGDRSGDRGMVDARSKIQARRHEGQRDYRSEGHSGSSPGDMDKSKYFALPDFKNRPGAPLEKPDMWIIGSSVIKDLEQYTDKVTGLSFADTVKEEVGTVSYHGELDLKISDLLQAVKHMLKTHTPPKIILFQCGENDQGAEMTREESEKMLEDMQIVKSEIPGVFLIWAQTLPAWHKPLLKRADVAQNQRRINHFMMQAICSDEISGGILYHYSLRVNQKKKYYRPATDQNLHLNLHGMRTLVGQLKAGIQYFIAGKGTIFPYITWPPVAIEDISPDFICMLNEEMIKDISNTMFNRMTKEQIQSLSSEQIEYFDPNQFSWLICPKFIASLSEEQLGKLSVFLFHLFSNSQIEMFSESLIEKLNAEVKDMIARRKEKIAKQELDALDYDATMFSTSKGTYEGFDQGYRGRGGGRGRGRPFIRAWGRGGYNNWFNNSENWHGAGDEIGKPDEGFEHNDRRGRSRSGSRERYSYRSRHKGRKRSSSRMSDDSSSSVDSGHRRRRKRHSRHRSHSSSSDSSSNSSSPRRRRRRSRSNERSRRGPSQGSNQALPPLPFAVMAPPGIHFPPPVSVATPSCPIPPPALAIPPISQANIPIPHQSRMPPPFFNPTTPPVTSFSQPPHFDGLHGGPPQIRFSPGPFNARPHPGPFMLSGPSRGPPPPHMLGPPCRPMFPGVMAPRGPEWQGRFPPHQFPPGNHRPPDDQAQAWKRQPMVSASNLANLTEVKTQIENTKMSVPKKVAKERSPSSSPDLYGDV